MYRRDWQRVSLRWFSLFGVGGPLLILLVNSLVGAAQPHYNFLTDYASDLAARGRPGGGILCVLWGSFPLLFGPFAVALHAGLRGHRFGRISPILLVLFAFYIGLCGIFPYDPASPEDTPSSRAHVIVSTLASAALFPGPFFLWLATRHDASWKGFRKFSLCVQAAGVMGAVLLLLAFMNWFNYGGFAERIYWGVYYTWIFALAIKLRRMARSASPDAEAPGGHPAPAVERHPPGAARVDGRTGLDHAADEPAVRRVRLAPHLQIVRSPQDDRPELFGRDVDVEHGNVGIGVLQTCRAGDVLWLASTMQRTPPPCTT